MMEPTSTVIVIQRLIVWSIPVYGIQKTVQGCCSIVLERVQGQKGAGRVEINFVECVPVGLGRIHQVLDVKLVFFTVVRDLKVKSRADKVCNHLQGGEYGVSSWLEQQSQLYDCCRQRDDAGDIG